MDKTTKTSKTLSNYVLLSEATGYSEVYCRCVLKGRRSQTSKGGKIILAKQEELNRLLDMFKTKNVN